MVLLPDGRSRTVLPRLASTLSRADAYSPTCAVRCVFGPQRRGRTTRAVTRPTEVARGDQVTTAPIVWEGVRGPLMTSTQGVPGERKQNG